MSDGSGGFSATWLEEMQNKERNAEAPWDMLESVPSHKQLWSSLWGNSSEKKSDGSVDPESQGFLTAGFSSASDAFWSTANQAKSTAQEATGKERQTAAYIPMVFRRPQKSGESDASNMLPLPAFGFA